MSLLDIDVARVTSHAKTSQIGNGELGDRLAMVETRLDYTCLSLSRIESRLDSLVAT